MADVVCPNTECPEHQIPKANLADFAVDEINCGACGGPVEPAAADTRRRTP